MVGSLKSLALAVTLATVSLVVSPTCLPGSAMIMPSPASPVPMAKLPRVQKVQKQKKVQKVQHVQKVQNVTRLPKLIPITSVTLHGPMYLGPTESANDPIVVRGTVSTDFIREIKEDMSSLPPGALRALAQAGYVIELSRTVTDAVPAARGQQVRGYEPHSTWNSVFGMFNRTSRKVVMAEYAENKTQGGLGTLNDRERRGGILRHEFGHAVDDYLGNISHTPAFRDAYERGIATISKDEEGDLSYFLQAGSAGPEETFAELFASLNGTACDRKYDDLLHKHFPELTKLIRDRIAMIK